MLQAVVRFVVGGVLVATLPAVAERAGTTTAGLLLLFPAVSFAGLLFLGRTQGLPAVASTSMAAVYGLPTVFAFLLTVHVTADRGLPLPLALVAGTVAWFVAATPIAVWRSRGSH